MYELNAHDSNFKQRSKSVFSTLDTLESSHVKTQVQNELECLNISNETERDLNPPGPSVCAFLSKHTPSQTEFQFKVPRVSPDNRSLKDNRSHHKTNSQPSSSYNHRPPYISNSSSRRGGSSRFTPDYLKNPKKWKKYSLEDVDELSAGANRSAAMSFLRTLSKGGSGGTVESDQDAFNKLADNVQFNKPIGRKKFNKFSDVVEEEESAVVVDERKDEKAVVDSSGGGFFKKKFKKRNMRRIEETNEVDEREDESGRMDHHMEIEKGADGIDEFDEFKEKRAVGDLDEEEAEFEERDLY
jgi:hypothetical protein